jgi:hypothetical protein
VLGGFEFFLSCVLDCSCLLHVRGGALGVHQGGATQWLGCDAVCGSRAKGKQWRAPSLASHCHRGPLCLSHFEPMCSSGQPAPGSPAGSCAICLTAHTIAGLSVYECVTAASLPTCALTGSARRYPMLGIHQPPPPPPPGSVRGNRLSNLIPLCCFLPPSYRSGRVVRCCWTSVQFDFRCLGCVFVSKTFLSLNLGVGGGTVFPPMPPSWPEVIMSKYS